MNITTFAGYAAPTKDPEDDAFYRITEILDDATELPFEFVDGMIVPRLEEVSTQGIYDAYRFDLLSTLAWIFSFPVCKEHQFNGEFTLSTYTHDKNGNTHEVTQVIEVVNSVAFPTLKINPHASSFTSKTPAYTREDIDQAVKAESEIAYRMGYDEGFVEGEENAQMDMAYNSPNNFEDF